MHNICRDCLITVPQGEAIIRSVTFRPVVYCRPCWDAHHTDRPAIVPLPRESDDEGLPRRWFARRRSGGRTA